MSKGEGEYSKGFNDVFRDVLKFLNMKAKEIKKEVDLEPNWDKKEYESEWKRKERRGGRREGLEYMIEKIER